MAPKLNWTQSESTAEVNHSWHRLDVTVSAQNSSKILDEIQFRLGSFMGFNGAHNRVALAYTSWEDDDARYAWFSMSGVQGLASRIPNGRLVPVRLWCNKLIGLVCGDTAGRHMLIGQRRWTVTQTSPNTLEVVTEAYERPRGLLNRLGMRLMGRSAQLEVWKAYLGNLATHLSTQFNCPVRMIPGPVVPVEGNPWSPRLPYPPRGGNC